MKRVVFTIPSYRRADRQLAVRWLSRLGYKPSEIFVAVQNDEDRAAYTDALRGVATVFGRNGVGVSFNRNQCLSVRPDARLVMVDDGVHGVSVKTPQGKCESVKTRERLDAMLSLMFDFAERNRVDVFSLNNSSSGLCATPHDFIDHPCVSIFMGMVNRRVQFDNRVRFLEDVERACRILRGGGGLIASATPSPLASMARRAVSTSSTQTRARTTPSSTTSQRATRSECRSIRRRRVTRGIGSQSTGTPTRSGRAFCSGRYDGR